MKKLIVVLCSVVLCLINSIYLSSPAQALLREHHQSPGVLRYHAQHSIKDKQQRAWQIVLFTEDQNSPVTKYYLRLVGFPGLVEFAHPQSLELITSEGTELIASDVYGKDNPANNVGQYDLTDIMSQLPINGSIKLVFSLLNPDQTVQDQSLKISSNIMTEWQWLYKH
jgi:hypothetical protein